MQGVQYVANKHCTLLLSFNCSVGSMMFLSPHWCFCPHYFSALPWGKDTCYPHIYRYFWKAQPMYFNMVGSIYPNFLRIMHFIWVKITPYYFFFLEIFLASAKFKTDLKSECPNNIFQFKIHYFSLNKTNFVSRWLILDFWWILKYIYWPYFVRSTSRCTGLTVKSHINAVSKYI